MKRLATPRRVSTAKPRRTLLTVEQLEDRLVPSTLPTAQYALTQDWGSGFQGQVTVRNPVAAAPVVNWQLAFDSGATINSTWDGSLVSHTGNHYVVKNAGWNADIAAGGNVSFGFVASGPSSAATPTHFVLNGISLDGSTPPPPALPTLSIADVSAKEGNSGTTSATFVVTLSAPATSPVTVTYATADGTAKAGSDYLAANGTVTFAAGETRKTITVAINGDTTVESDETYLIGLSAPTGATLARAQATGTIVNDDVPPPPPPPPATNSVQFSVTNSWTSGYQADVTVTNTGTTAIKDWVLEFDTSGTISSIWNAGIQSHVGNHYVVKNAGWNADLAPVASASFGFVASPGVITNWSLHANGSPGTGGGGGGGGTMNHPPVAVNDTAFTTQNLPVSVSVLANDTDADGNTLSVSSATQGQHGAVVVNANGTIGYTPTTGYVGTDSFTYVVSDGKGGTATGSVSVTVSQPTAPSAWPSHVFAPFVDLGLYPTYDLVSAARDQGVKYFNLAFVVADPNNQPSWGGYQEYAVNGSAFDLNLRTQVAGVRALGGDVVVSFGGASGQELAQTITNVSTLTNAYQKVINAYNLTRIDFDIEGAAVADHASIDRRSQAIAALQRDAAAAGKSLAVWFTLPVLPTGLTADGMYVLQSALRYGVVIGGVNVMAMDYGASAAPNPMGHMGDYAIQAATSTFTQLQGLYGSSRTDAQLWNMVGVTPMIGLNDVTTETFTQADARQLLAFAQQKGLGEIAMWDLNRDMQNGAGKINYVDLKSSSLVQTPYEFSHIFAAFTG